MATLFIRLFGLAALAALYLSSIHGIGQPHIDTATQSYVYLMNIVCLMAIGNLIFSTAYHQSTHAQWAQRHPLSKAYAVITALLWLAVLAFAGWQTSFAIQCIYYLLLFTARDLNPITPPKGEEPKTTAREKQ